MREQPRERRDVSPFCHSQPRRFFWITVFPAISRREVILMNVQIFDKRFSEMWLQMATVAIVTLALIALGARYVW